MQVNENHKVPEYILVPSGEKDIAILILDGECKGVKYTYGVITPKDLDNPEKPVLEYHYDVLENPLDCTTEQLHRATAIILNQVMMKMVEEGGDIGYTMNKQEGDTNESADVDGETNTTELIDE